MKTKSAIYTVLLAGLLLPIFLNCKKEAIKTVPTVSITAATNITATTASAGGDITSDGGAEITIRGICWSTNQSPTTSESKTTNGTGTGSFTGSITGLTPGATYNVRAYATNSVGTGYSSQISFTTPALAPVLTTTDATAIISISASSGGNITNDGGSPITARGVCWGAAQSPTTANSKTTDGSGTGIFTSAITGLTPGTTYYIRAYATNSIGTSYGNQVTLVTTAVLSTLTTTAASAITSTTATSGGNITNDGGGAITARGVCWSTSQNPTTANSKTADGTGTGSFISSITGLTAGTTYYVRAYSTNSAGIGYGNQVSFSPDIQLTESVNGVSFDMVAIKGGTFSMGSNDGDSDEKPIHTVTLSDFYMGKTEVTQAQWVAVMGSNPSWFKGDNLPVETVSWDDVQIFLGKFNAKTGKTYRLPTEAEWEYAAGGSVGQKWPGTNNESSLGNYAWYDANSNDTTHAVGAKQPNSLGLYDMGGNVWEWCSDWYSADYYANSPQTNPKGASTGSGRVLRGGSWNGHASYCRVSFRFCSYPDYRYYSYGFRLVCSFQFIVDFHSCFELKRKKKKGN